MLTLPPQGLLTSTNAFLCFAPATDSLLLKWIAAALPLSWNYDLPSLVPSFQWKKYSNHSHLVCYESAAFFVLYHLFLWLSTRGAWSSIPVCWDKLGSPFLASGSFPVLCFWSTSTKQPFEGSSSCHRFKPFLAFPSASSYIFTCVHHNFSAGSNTGMLKVIFFFLIPPLCSACSSVLWQNKFLKDQSPIVNKDQDILVILHYMYWGDGGRFYVIFSFPMVSFGSWVTFSLQKHSMVSTMYPAWLSAHIFALPTVTHTSYSLPNKEHFALKMKISEMAMAGCPYLLFLLFVQ